MTGSTQDDALAWLREEGALPGRCVAGRQSGGRGRGGNRWNSPEGGLYISVIVPTQGGPDPLLPLAVGTELAEMLDAGWGIPVRLKWPNDLVIAAPRSSPEKLGGVLVDAPALAAAVIVGVGLNVNVRRDDLAMEIRAKAAILAELVGRAVDLDDLEQKVDASVRSAVRRIGDVGGREKAVQRSRSRLYGIGRAVTVDGEPVGRMIGIAADGALVVERHGDLHAIHAGELAILGD
ncbi:MAG: biotin--[acetyl-CoA-carboxylase] ligase [Thermoplasmata archaeon]|nr:biotin--[acetyl-CoA-carboxylase] ligase [Thermoplasmata archaeon]